jgi:hypothetical protein
VLSKSRIFKSLKRDCGSIPVAEITSGKIEIFSKHQRFLIATESSKYLLIFVLYVCVILCEFGTAKNLLHSLGLVYKSMRGMMTNSIDRDQWLNVTSESRDRIWPFFLIILNFALSWKRTRDPRVPESKRTPLGYILP